MKWWLQHLFTLRATLMKLPGGACADLADESVLDHDYPCGMNLI